MPEETVTPGEMPTEQEQPEPTLAEVQAELERTREALSKANKQALKYRKIAKQEPAPAAQPQTAPGEMPETERLKQERQAALDQAKSADEKSRKRLIRAAFIAEASKLQVKNPQDAYALATADGVDIEIDDDDNVEGVEEAVKALVDAGRLVVTGRPPAPSLEGGAGSGNRPMRTVQLTDEEKALARRANMTEQQYIAYLTAVPGEDTQASIAEALKPKN